VLFRSEKPAVRTTVRTAVVVFLVFSILPIWTAWYVGEWEAAGEQATLWGSLVSVAPSANHLDGVELFAFYRSELLKLAVVLAISLAIGWWRGRRHRITSE
jgi:hypothetical protein